VLQGKGERLKENKRGRVMVAPVIVGGGARLVERARKDSERLEGKRRAESGRKK
jgi:hypothetical protein